jgi:hypothetical protein
MKILAPTSRSKITESVLAAVPYSTYPADWHTPVPALWDVRCDSLYSDFGRRGIRSLICTEIRGFFAWRPDFRRLLDATNWIRY